MIEEIFGEGNREKYRQWVEKTIKMNREQMFSEYVNKL